MANKPRVIKFVCNAVRWFDRLNGNTYHSVRITRCRDGAVIVGEWCYGYDDHYKQTALHLMADNKWLPVKYRGKTITGSGRCMNYEREKNYPIQWDVSDGLKRDMVTNGIL